MTEQERSDKETAGGHTCCYCPQQPVPLPCCNPGHYKTAADCPAVSRHTPHPAGYLAHADWAEKMLKTHIQRRCPICHYWVIWDRLPQIPADPLSEFGVL